MKKLVVLAWVMAGCLPEPRDERPAIECAETSDCNAAAGEVCELGVCWGDPPRGTFSAILVPSTAIAPDAVMTAVPLLELTPDGWIQAADGGGLTLDRGVAMTGRVTIPCPDVLPACDETLALPGQIRWSRPAGFPGGPRLTGAASVGADGLYQLVVPEPRADAPIALTLTFTPSKLPLGAGLPSPAMLMAPFEDQLVLTADAIGANGKITRDLALDPSTLRTVTGRITRPFTAQRDGWQLQADVVVEGAAGARQLVSTIAVTDVEGNFTLRVATEYPVVDVLCTPPPSPSDPLEDVRHSVRARDVVVAELTGPMRDIVVPQPSAAEPVEFRVRGTDGSGGTVDVDGATVIVRLGHPLGGNLQLELEAQVTTGADGKATVMLFPVVEGIPLTYTADVLPGPTSELASQYQVPFTVPATPAIELTRRRSLVGRVLGAEGAPVADATVSATLSAATLCALSTSAARAARNLASAQIATNAKGEFTLFVDDDLAGVPLTYDVAVRPATGDGRPQWSFTDRVPTADGDRVDLQLPDGAAMRAVLFSADHGPVGDAAMSIYEQVEGAPGCMSLSGAAGGAVLRGVATADAAGTAAIVLPRPLVEL